MMKIIAITCSSILSFSDLPQPGSFFYPFIAKISSSEYLDLGAFAMLLITGVGLVRLMKNNKNED